jgi:hypothetical protein
MAYPFAGVSPITITVTYTAPTAGNLGGWRATAPWCSTIGNQPYYQTVSDAVETCMDLSGRDAGGRMAAYINSGTTYTGPAGQ